MGKNVMGNETREQLAIRRSPSERLDCEMLLAASNRQRKLC
ncbi:hypothetical protein EC9_40240 [Rosistilla ulvae]|uniref:Uncharacterized protein n=1 Tax=Rosistilla ulvae TaxID=1930277 RepID=A0A517M4M6_9BACT|nr:hypothetical protein EC9_40240 [Rosistilla ulvae]